MDVTIYHNPRCSKSRATLKLLLDRGLEPNIVEYLHTPPSKTELRNILKMLAISPRDLMRKNEAIYKENGLSSTKLSDDDLITAMTRDPILIERPIVVANGRAAIGRPPEAVLDIV